jgi:type II restriction enzyme
MPKDWQQALTNSPTFQAKSWALQNLILDAIRILEAFHIPTDQTPRRLERMALAFLAVAHVRHSDDWRIVKDNAGQHTLTTRQLIGVHSLLGANS